jgi:glycosyltransferase involved in cell wall biosynthesis
MRLAAELGAEVISFKRQFPRRFYPGRSDVDESLASPPRTRFLLDILNPFTWIRTAFALRRARPDAVIVVWWVWVWALPYRILLSLLPRGTRVILQCHNIGDKEPAAWKRWLTDLVLRRADALVVHAQSDAVEARRRVRTRVVRTFLPVQEGRPIPSYSEARATLGLQGNIALCFGLIRPYKGVDLALRAWRLLQTEVTLVVAGEVWWNGERELHELARGLENVRLDLRYIPEAEVANYFAATDVVLAPYRNAAQSAVATTAFHFARPIIATRVGGLPDIIEDGVNGMLIPPEDPAALARAVDAFFTTADRAAMERAAAESARKYSWEEYGNVFRDLVTANERRTQSAERRI